MKKETLLIVLVVALMLTVGAYFFVINKKKKEGKAATEPNGNDANLYAQPTGLQGVGGGVAQQPSYPQQTYYPATATQPYFPGANAPVQAQPINGMLVKIIQAAANLKVDGILGPKTNAAIQTFGVDIMNAYDVNNKIAFPSGATKFFPLKKGDKNNYVKALQIMLGLTPDGNFGAKTEAALIAAKGGGGQCFATTYLELYEKISGIVISKTGTKSGSGYTTGVVSPTTIVQGVGSFLSSQFPFNLIK